LLLLAGDARIGLGGDFRIGLNETAIGLAMPACGVEIARDRLAPTHFQRAVINAELFSLDGAATAGFLDQVVAAANFDATVSDAAKTLANLDAATFAEVKRRMRQATLDRIAELES